MKASLFTKIIETMPCMTCSVLCVKSGWAFRQFKNKVKALHFTKNNNLRDLLLCAESYVDGQAIEKYYWLPNEGVPFN